MKDSQFDTGTTYFTDYFHRNYAQAIIGFVMLLFGFLCFWVGFSFYYVAVYVIGAILAVTGLIIFLVGTFKRIPDERIEQSMEFKLAGQNIEIDTDRSYFVKLLDDKKEIVIEGYRFHEGVMIKRLVSAELRTSEFSRSKIRILKDRVYILNREISLISDRVVDTVYEPTFDKIVSIEIVRDRMELTFDKKTYIAKPCLLVITTTESVISLPCIDAITTDEIPKKIMKRSAEYFEELAAKNAKPL